jgi:hypothetical protein
VFGSDDSTHSQDVERNSPYQMFNDSTSATDDGDGEDGGARGSGYYIAPSGGT